MFWADIFNIFNFVTIFPISWGWFFAIYRTPRVSPDNHIESFLLWNLRNNFLMPGWRYQAF